MSIAANASPGSIEWERASATRARRRSTHVGAEEAIREPDQHASEQRPSHELVVKWLRNPAHSLCPLKIFVE